MMRQVSRSLTDRLVAAVTASLTAFSGSMTMKGAVNGLIGMNAAARRASLLRTAQAQPAVAANTPMTIPMLVKTADRVFLLLMDDCKPSMQAKAVNAIIRMGSV